MSQNLLNQAHALIQVDNLTDPQCQIHKLAGDASLRRYYRLRTPENTFILMLIEPFDAAKNDFLLVRAHLEKCEVPVPRLLAVDAAKGAILLEDLGDCTMLHRLGDKNEPEAEQGLFRESLDLLAKFHSNTRAKPGTQPTPGYALAFDEPKLMWEVDFALEHLFGSYLKRQIPEKEFRVIRESFVDICRRLAAEPRVFTHRDYHSRNIMIPDRGGMVCIDFQDARMGLRAYDLASILRDSYYQLSEERVYDLVNYYCGLADKDEIIDRRHFVQVFDLMSIQRNFKAIGSFTSFYGKRNDASYIRFVGNTFENIRRNLAKFPEYRELRKLLFQYYYF
ncbi:MAG: aminoglycoside phosphotransferase family protein [Bacteriovoracia bacterium]